MKGVLAAGTLTAASIIGLDYLLPSGTKQVQSSYTNQTLSSIISKVTESSSTQLSSTQLYTLQGQLFFDYNGNGIQGGEEPAIEGGTIRLTPVIVTGSSVIPEATTDSSGDWSLDAPADSYNLKISADPKFKMMCTSDEEVTPVANGYSIKLFESGSMNIGLMVGHETFPLLFPFDPYKNADDVFHYVDDGDVEDPDETNERDWMGGHNTAKGEQGFDIICDIGTPVVATAPGVVICAENDYGTNPDLAWVGNRVMIDHLNGFRLVWTPLE